MADGTIAPFQKVCTYCREAMPATTEFFHPHSMGKNGLAPRCRSCVNSLARAKHGTDEGKAKRKAYRDANRERNIRYQAEYRKTHSSTDATREWRARNLEHARKRERERRRQQRQNPATRLKHRISTRLYLMLRDKSGKSTEGLLGFTRDDLVRHIERQFTPGMSWDKVMSGDIHVDHILPIASFNIVSVDDPDFKVCWALTNLRPMWADKNRRKGSRREHLI